MPLKAPRVELLHHLSQDLCQAANLQHHRTWQLNWGDEKKVANGGKLLPLTANLQIQLPCVFFPGGTGKRLGGSAALGGSGGTAPSALPPRCGDPGVPEAGSGGRKGSGAKAGTPQRPGLAGRGSPLSPRQPQGRQPSGRSQKRSPLRDSPPRPGLRSSRYRDRAAPPRLPRRLPRQACVPRPAARVRPGPAEPRAEPWGLRAPGEAERAASGERAARWSPRHGAA